MLHLPGREPFGVDVGNFLELQGRPPWPGDGRDPAPGRENSGPRSTFGPRRQAVSRMAGSALSNIPGRVVRVFTAVSRTVSSKVPLWRGPAQGQKGEQGQLAAHGLGGGHADFRSGLSIQNPVRFTGHGRAHHVGTIPEPARPSVLASRSPARVSAVSPDWLMTEDHVPGPQDHVPVAKLRSDLHPRGQTGPTLHEVHAEQPGMVGGAAGHGCATAPAKRIPPTRAGSPPGGRCPACRLGSRPPPRAARKSP